MSELIDRDELLQQINLDSFGVEGSYGDTWKFLDTIENMPSVKPEPHWIPNTKETVPKDPLRKQIQLKNGWIITGWFDGEDWLPVPEVGASLLFDNVLAWCELPSPYQPEEESE